ncbi:hypothetical protein PHET_02739 [Paragonimus heterotremus]|uniref:Uncharacterized protein n=1 Tax=Paragonimus heterotremus TaxID=100268 RepID=A0A8J4T1L7_9TREM|nr:hypothetical protein PHET_02739 [Paragonimus heterotremus]
MNCEGDLKKGFLSIRCHDYHVLILNNGLPEKQLSVEFMMSLDAIVLIQWTIQTDTILTSLLIQIANICHEKKAGQVQTIASSSQRYYCNLRCLILSRNLCESWAKSSSLTHSHCEGFTDWPFRSEALRMAAKLGLTVLQLSRSSQAGQVRWKMVDRLNGRLLTPNTCTLANKEPEMNSQRTVYRVRSFSVDHGNDLLFRGPRSGLVLFQKLGLGSLELVPVFEMRGLSPQWISKHRTLPGRLTQSLTYASGLDRSPSASVQRPRSIRGHASNAPASSIDNTDGDHSQLPVKQSKINATYKRKEAGEDGTFRCWNAQACISTVIPNEEENEVALSAGSYQAYGPKVPANLHAATQASTVGVQSALGNRIQLDAVVDQLSFPFEASPANGEPQNYTQISKCS